LLAQDLPVLNESLKARASSQFRRRRPKLLLTTRRWTSAGRMLAWTSLRIGALLHWLGGRRSVTNSRAATATR